MASELSNQLLASARERYDRTAKWSALATVLVVLFHLVVFVRYVDLSKDAAAARTELGQFNQRHDSITKLDAALTTVHEKVSGWFDQRLKDNLACIKKDFVSLSSALGDVREDRAGSYLVVDAIEAGGEGPGFPPMDNAPFLGDTPVDDLPNVAQMPLEVAQARLEVGQSGPVARHESMRVWRLPPPLVEGLKQRARGDLAELLRPVVDLQIVGPHFEQMNAEWSQSVSDELASQVTAAGKELDHLILTDREHELTWTQMRASVDQASERLHQVRFVPPQDKTWWYTTKDKDQRFADMRKEVDAPIQKALAGTAGLEAIRQAFDRAIEARKADLVAIQEEQKQLVERFQKQSEVLAGLGEPFKFLAADLGYLITRFPLLIGLLLAATAVMSARSLAGLLDAARVAEGPDGRKSTIEALSIRGTGSTGPVVWRAILGVAWIGLAAWALRGWPGEEARAMPLFIATGVAAVLIGEGYRAWLLRRALRAKA